MKHEDGKKVIFFVSITILITGTIFFFDISSPFETSLSQNSQVVSPFDDVVEPIIVSVTPEKSVINPTPTTIEPKMTTVSPSTVDFKPDSSLQSAYGMNANSKTVRIHEWAVPTEDARVATIDVVGTDTVYFTERDVNKLGRLVVDINTNEGTITEWDIPSPGVPNNNIPDLDYDENTGMVWFTEAIEDRIGRLNPITGDILIWDIPRPFNCPKGTCGLSPRGVTVDNNGNVWYVEMATMGNRVNRLDPNTNLFTQWAIPTHPTSPTCQAKDSVADPLGNVWIACRNADNIVKLDPATDNFTVWKMPDHTCKHTHNMHKYM